MGTSLNKSSIIGPTELKKISWLIERTQTKKRAGADAPSTRSAIPVDLRDAPRSQPLVLDLPGESGRVRCRLDRERGEDTGGLVVPMPITRRSVPAGEHHEWSVQADDPHHVAQDRLLIPASQRLVECLRVAVVDGRGEVLIVESVVAAREPELLGPDQPQGVEELRPDRVGTAFPPVEGQEARTHPHAPTQRRQHTRFLVVGVACRVEDARGGPQLPELLAQGGHPLVGGEEARRTTIPGLDEDSIGGLTFRDGGKGNRRREDGHGRDDTAGRSGHP